MAAAVPEEASNAVGRSLAPLRDRFPKTRWMRPELLHLTLVFLGDTDPARVDEIGAVLATVARRHGPYLTTVSGAGGRVDDRPNARRGGVGWLTLGNGFAETAALALDVDRAVGSATYDARRQPRPHLTVARTIDAPTLGALRDFARNLTLEWTTERLVLFRSYTGPTGSRYEELVASPLPA